MSEEKKGWRQEVPQFLQFVESALGNRIRGHRAILGYDMYFVDLAEWKLRFSDRSPFICVAASDLEAMDTAALSQSLLDVIRTAGLNDRNPVVLVDGSGQELQARFKEVFLPVLVLDRSAQHAIMESRRPTGELLDHISAQLDLASLAPYETSEPVTGSRFFGREMEVRRVVTSGRGNFAIMGIRRIGKTSLMHEIERQIREQARERSEPDAGQRVLFLDCSAIASPAELMREVVRALHPQELPRLENRDFPLFFPDFLRRMARQYGGPLVFLLDEFDEILSWHRKDSALLNSLRSSSNQGSARFIIAGFREVLHAFSSLDSPLYNFARPIRLKEFTFDQTLAMVTGPLEKLRVRFERRNEVVNRIYDETAGQPNLIQFYCTYLVEQLDREEKRVVTPDSLFDVYGNEDFRSFILGTFMDNTTHLEKALVFAIVENEDNCELFGMDTIDSLLLQSGIQVPLVDMEHALRDLELAGTLVASGRHYRFAAPVFPRMLRENYDVKYLFRKVLSEGIW